MLCNKLFISCGRLSIFICFLGAGCATQGYGGAERPEGETARIAFFSSKPLELSNLSVDGKSQGLFDLGIRVLPGTHTAYASFEIREQDCDEYGCETARTTGSCRATVRAEAGKSYAIRVRGYSADAYLSVEESESAEVAGSGSCSADRTTRTYEPRARSR